MQSISHVHFFFPTKLSHKFTYPTSSSLQSRCTIPLTAICFEFLYPCILFPNTGKIPDKMICPTLACFVFFSMFLNFSTIAVVPSLSALFVLMWTSRVPPFPRPMIRCTLPVTSSILALGKKYDVLLLVQCRVGLPNYGVYHIYRRVPLDSINHCRWILLSSFSILSHLSSNLGSISPLFVSFFPGCVAFLFLESIIYDDHEIGQPPVLVVVVLHQVDYCVVFIQIQLISHGTIRVLLITVRCKELCSWTYHQLSTSVLPFCSMLLESTSLSITVSLSSDEMLPAVFFPVRFPSVELLSGVIAQDFALLLHFSQFCHSIPCFFSFLFQSQSCD